MFTKTNETTTKGMQASKWDKHYEEFKQGGDTLWAPEDAMAPAAAAQFAARMRVLEAKLGGTRKFHSGHDKVTHRTFVRVRPDNELPSADEEKEEKSEDEKAPE